MPIFLSKISTESPFRLITNSQSKFISSSKKAGRRRHSLVQVDALPLLRVRLPDSELEVVPAARHGLPHPQLEVVGGEGPGHAAFSLPHPQLKVV